MAPISERDTAMPNTAYGVSKLKSEHYLQSLNDFPTVIFRPTGVYGPRERDYFLMAKSIKQHIDFAPGFKKTGSYFYLCEGFGTSCLFGNRTWSAAARLFC